MKYLLKDLRSFEEIVGVLSDARAVGEYLDNHPEINTINDSRIEIDEIVLAFKDSINDDKYENTSVPEDKRKYTRPVSITYRLSLCKNADEFDELFNEMLKDVCIFSTLDELNDFKGEKLLSCEDAKVFYMKLLRVTSSLYKGF